MKYSEHMYVGDSLQGKQHEIEKKLRQGKTQLMVYVIVLVHHRLEFYNSVLLQQDGFDSEGMVVGIAGGYEEALQVIAHITDQVYEETKGADICAYLQQRSGQ